MKIECQHCLYICDVPENWKPAICLECFKAVSLIMAKHQKIGARHE